MSEINIEEALELTPRKVVEQKLKFSIPLYQRLFEWTDEEIKTLLSNLKDSFNNTRNNPKPYYIGLLTAFKSDEENGRGEVYSLVDGQQRFTVMTLMAIVMQGAWDSFHSIGGQRRLFFFARNEDNDYLTHVCNTGDFEAEYYNKKMKDGLYCIKTYLEENFQSDQERNEFKNYIYNYMTFFITTLPDSYTLSDLNKYFEAMNSTGKSLENHEQLKVDLLKKLPKDNTELGKSKLEKYTRLWNVVADLNKEIVRKRKGESLSKKRERLYKAIYTAYSNPLNLFEADEKISLINDIYNYTQTETKDEDYVIGNISASSVKPKYNTGTTEEKAMFSFPVFLLLVLYTVIEDKKKINNIAEFFKISNLRENFKKYLPNNKVELFFQKLVIYRLYLDCFFIRTEENDKTYPYTLKNFIYDDDGDDEESPENSSDEEKEFKNRLKHFQSMLLVSSTAFTFYRWIEPAFTYLDTKIEESRASGNNEIKLTSKEFLNKLKAIDNNIHPLVEINNENLSYGKIDRYWFWRLDYYLWEKRSIFFKKDSLEVANNYIFKRNRSIEHIAPQKPKDNASSEFIWNEDTKDIENCFGNLCMISSGQNSMLQNETFKRKRAYVEDYISKNLNGTIESLKMLKIYEYNNWTRATIENHRDKMIKVLIDSYKID